MDLMSLLAKLTLDKDDYDKGLEEAQKSAENLNIPPATLPSPNTQDFTSGVTTAAEESGSIFDEVMTGVWQGLKDSFVQIVGISAVTGAMRYIKEGIKLSFQNGKAIADGAKNLGISTKAYQEYEYILGKSNLKMKDLTAVMKRMDEIMGDKELTEDQAKFMEELGINAGEAADKEQLLADIMNSITGYEGSDRGRIIEWLFGSSANWDGYFSQTQEEIDKLKEQADGLLMSDAEVENAKKLNDTYERLQDTLESIQRSVGEKFLPLIEQLVSKVADLVAWLSGNGGDGDLNNQLKNTETELAKTQATIEGTAKSAEDMVNKYFEMSDAEKQAAENQEALKENAKWLIDNIPELADAIDEETGAITGEKDALIDRISAWKESASAQAKSNAETEKQNILTDAGNKIAEKQDAVRAKQIEAQNKINEQAALMTGMIESNPALARIFENQYGTTQVTAGSEDFMDQLRFLQSNAYRYGLDSGTLNTMEEDYKSLTSEMQALQSEAASLQEQLAQATAATGASAQAATGEVNALNQALGEIPSDVYTTIHIATDGEGYPRAIGDSYIPFDNFPALLHRGERVLTSTEARNYREGNAGSNADVVSALQGLRNDMRNIKLVVGRKTFGEAVVDYGGERVNEYIGGADSRYAAGFGT